MASDSELFAGVAKFRIPFCALNPFNPFGNDGFKVSPPFDGGGGRMDCNVRCTSQRSGSVS